MAIDQTAMAATALRLITDNGKSFTLRNKSEGSYDPATNAITGSSNTDETIYGIMTSYKKFQIDDQNIKIGDKKLLVAASGITGNVDQDSIIIEGSDQWSVVHVEEISPGSTVIIYQLQVRR